MVEEKEIWNKVSRLFEDSKKRKIDDFDSGLLNESFEPITGSPQEKYEKICQRLVNIASRLENLRLNDNNGNPEKYIILKQIDEFLKKRLPKITSNVDDYSQEKGRILSLSSGDSTMKCIPENFVKTIEIFREEQYQVLAKEGQILEYKARAVLDNKFFSWHKDDMYEEIDVTEEEMIDDGRSGDGFSSD